MNGDNTFALNVDSTSYPVPVDDYLHEVTAKTNICLHATAGGSLSGAVETLSKEDHISVHFIVDKDGKVYQFFPLRYWAFHMGIKNTGGRYDRRTIGIEIVNVGPLQRRGDLLCYWPNNFGSRFCSINDTSWYTKTPVAFRGYEYWANFTKPQYESVAMLCAYLCKLENIPPVVLEDVDEYHLDKIDQFNGIFTHTSVRTDKYDVGKAWSWKYFQTALDNYTSQLNAMPSVPTDLVSE